jgi:hypothetical protein
MNRETFEDRYQNLGYYKECHGDSDGGAGVHRLLDAAAELLGLER